jgi:hypothetical protein
MNSSVVAAKCDSKHRPRESAQLAVLFAASDIGVVTKRYMETNATDVCLQIGSHFRGVSIADFVLRRKKEKASRMRGS